MIEIALSFSGTIQSKLALKDSQLKVISAQTKQISDLLTNLSSDEESSVPEEDIQRLNDSAINLDCSDNDNWDDNDDHQSSFPSCSNQGCMKEKRQMKDEIRCLQNQVRHFIGKYKLTEINTLLYPYNPYLLLEM